MAVAAGAAVLLPGYLRLALLLCGCLPSSAAGQAVMLAASAVRVSALYQVAQLAWAAAPGAREAWGAAWAVVSSKGGSNGGSFAASLLAPLHPSVILQAVLLPLAVGVWVLAAFARPAKGWWWRRRVVAEEEAWAAAAVRAHHHP